MKILQTLPSWVNQYLNLFGAKAIRDDELNAYQSLLGHFSDEVIETAVTYMRKSGIPPFGRSEEYCLQYLKENQALLFLVNNEVSKTKIESKTIESKLRPVPLDPSL